MTRAELELLYAEAGSISELARRLGIPFSTARSRLVAAGVALRTTGYRSPKSVSRKGPDHHNWRGGTYDWQGYVYEYAPDHPAAAAAKGYVLQHRLVMEQELGRPLLEDEIVHHRNGDKSDNRPENLEVTSRDVHSGHHKEGAKRDTLGRFV